MKLGLCVGLDRLQEAADAGFTFAEIAVSELLAAPDDAAFAKVADRIRAAPLPVEAANCFIPAELKVTGPDVNMPALRRHMEKALERAGHSGLSIVVFGSGGARRLPEGFPAERGWAQLADAARMAADIGGRHGVTIVMEPLLKRACNFFNRVDQGAAFVDRVGHPRLRLLADLFHMQAEAEPMVDVANAGARLAHIHLATPALPETGPGTEYDFEGFIAALRKAGYDGRLSVEDNPGLLHKHQPPLTPVYRAVIAYLVERCQIE